jgi:hypothetical protein
MSNELNGLILYIDGRCKWEDYMSSYMQENENITESELIERWNNAHTPMDLDDDSDY